jgi:putative transposase
MASPSASTDTEGAGHSWSCLEEVRAAVVEFKDFYNRHWCLEKLGFMSTHEARQAAALKEVA